MKNVYDPKKEDAINEYLKKDRPFYKKWRFYALLLIIFIIILINLQ